MYTFVLTLIKRIVQTSIFVLLQISFASYVTVCNADDGLRRQTVLAESQIAFQGPPQKLARGEAVVDDNHVLAIVPRVESMKIGEEITFIAILRDVRSKEEAPVIVDWASSSRDIVSILQSGKAKANKLGSSEIIARRGNVKATLTIEVKPLTEASIAHLSTEDPKARVLDDDITRLISDLIKPTQSNVDRAAELIANAAAQGHENDLEKALRSLLLNDLTGRMVILSLSRYRVVTFDPDLASMMLKSNPNNPEAPTELLLSAVATSGGRQCTEVLKEWSRTSFQAPATGPSETQLHFRRVLWKTYFSLAPASSTSDAINFYSTAAGRFELEHDQEVADMTVVSIDFVSRQRDGLLRLLQAYNLFLGTDRLFGPPGSFPAKPLLDTGPSTSQRFKVCKAIEQSLLNVRDPSPLILSTLLRFTNADDAGLAGPARAADYSPIERAPWLLPGDSLVYTADINSPAFAVIKKLRIGLPRNLLFLPEEKYEFLSNYEKLAVARQAATPSGDFRSEAEVNRVTKAFADPILRYLGGSLGLDISKAQIDPKLQPSFDPNLPYRYLSIRTVNNVLNEAVSAVLKDVGQSSEEAFRLSGVLIAKELERRSLVLYSILAARRRTGNTQGSIDLSKMDEVLDSLSEIVNQDGIIKSQVVDEITPETDKSLEKSTPPDCRSAAFTVLARRYSFNQGLYEEHVRVSCASGENNEIKWTGGIPITMVLALRRHPRLLDFPAVSLAAREIKAETTNADPVMDDIDYVRHAPILTIGYLATAINTPDLPWSSVRDSIALETNFGNPEFFISTTAQTMTSQPALVPTPIRVPGLTIDAESQRFLDAGFPGGLGVFRGAFIANSDDSFAIEASQMRQPLTNFWTQRVLHMENQRVKEAVERINTDKNCDTLDAYCWGRKIAGDPLQNEADLLVKNTVLRKLNQAIANANVLETYFQAWDLGAVRNQRIKTLILREMVLKPNLSEFCAIYEVRTDGGVVRFFVTGGKLAPLPDIVIQALVRDPFFLSRYNIDLAQTTEGSDARLASALTKKIDAQTGLEVLNRTGFYPLSSSNVKLNPSAPLYKTIEGRIRATEMTVLSEIWTIAEGESLPNNDIPKSTFINLMNEQWGNIESMLREKVNKDTQPIIDDLNRTKDTGWSIGVSVTLGLPLPVFTGSFSYGSLGINLSTSFSGTVTVSGSVNGNQLPFGFDIKLNTSTADTTAANTARNREAYDAALAYVPTRMAVEGTLYRAVTSVSVVSSIASLSSGENSSVPQQQPGSLTVNTAIPSTWLQLPPLPTKWRLSSDRQSEGIWLSGLVAGAASKLTNAEVEALTASISAGMISDEMLSLLTTRRNEAIEEANIAARRWMRTTEPVPELVPEMTGDVPLTDSQRSAYVQSENAKSYTKFQQALAKAQSEFKPKEARILSDGLPAVTLTYGNNFAYMRFRFAYKLVNGAEVSFERIQNTPFFLVDQIRADPQGHVYEIFVAAATGEIIRVAGAPNSLLAKAEKAKLDQAVKFREQLKQVVNGMTVSARLRQAIEEFFKDLQAWFNAQKPGDGVAVPFIPPLDGTPMLNFFPSPYEWSLRRDESVGQVLTSQRQSVLANQFRSGSIVITNPPPFP